MKNYCLFCLCLFLLRLSATAQERHLLPAGSTFCRAQCSLGIVRADTRDTTWNATPSDDTLLLYRIDHGAIAGRMIPAEGWHTFVADSLPPGVYRLAYTNLYGQRLEKQLALHEGRQTITLYTDSLRDYEPGALDIMEDGDWLELQFERNGCFEMMIRQLRIDKMQGRFRARLYEVWRRNKYNDKTHTIKQLYKRGKLLREVWLSGEQITAFTRFENELHTETTMGCTTTDRYTLRSGAYYHDLDRLDGSCDWNGYDYLERDLFGVFRGGLWDED